MRPVKRATLGPLPYLWLVGGFAITIIGAFQAVQEIGRLYDQVSMDPLAEPEIPEKERPARMLWHAGTAGVGVVCIGTGTLWLKVRRARRRAAAVRAGASSGSN